MRSAAPAHCRSVRNQTTGDATARATRRGVAGGTFARSGRPASTDRTSARSPTVVASAPFSLAPNHESTPSPDGTTPLPGLSPTRPHAAAGTRIDPMPSALWATGTRPAATAAPLPPPDPPLLRLGSQGLRVMRVGESVAAQMQSSGTAVMPTTTAPADRSRAVTG